MEKKEFKTQKNLNQILEIGDQRDLSADYKRNNNKRKTTKN